MKRPLLLCVGLFFIALASNGQYLDYGRATQPDDAEIIDPLPYYGEELEFEFGYHVGDEVGDFTVYDFDGNSFNLYETLSNGKPTFLMSGSASCIRFTDAFHNINSMLFNYGPLKDLIANHIDDFNWAIIYGVEAHPGEGECPSNCPPGYLNDTLVVQHPDYLYRRYALKDLVESPAHEFPIPMYADNPDNAVYNNFFARPFGAVIIDCNGEVVMRGDWAQQFAATQTDAIVAILDTPCTPSEQPPVEEEEEAENEVEDEMEEEAENGDEEEEVEGEEENNPLFVWDIYATDLLRIYPSPSATFTNIEIPKDLFTASVIVRFYDVHGQIALEKRLTSNFKQINVSELANGTYVVEIMNLFGERMFSRFIKA